MTIYIRPIPTNRREIEGELSNLDFTIDEGVEAELRSGDTIAGYAGWNFYGEVWYEPDDDLFYCGVKQYCAHVDTIAEATLLDLMHAVSRRYGYD